MDEISFIIKGMMIGLSVAAPVGPIGVLCIRRTLARGRAAGLISGLGAATADAIYGAVAGFGLTLISNFLIAQQLWLRLIGGLFLLFLGARILISKPSQKDEPEQENGAFGDYASTFFLTITNPTTILSFAGIFAGLGLGSTGGDYSLATALVSGVFLGSALWWLILSEGVNIFRQKASETILPWANTISGVIILTFGIIALASFIKSVGWI